jgi:hypothetical protein
VYVYLNYIPGRYYGWWHLRRVADEGDEGMIESQPRLPQQQIIFLGRRVDNHPGAKFKFSRTTTQKKKK